MPVEADRKYKGKIVEAFVPDVGNGKPCLHVEIETAVGNITHRMYLSPAARQYTEKVLLELGLENAHLSSEEFWEDPIRWMRDLECNIETELHSYQDDNGNDRDVVRVKWLNGPRREILRAPVAKARGLAGLFQRPNYETSAAPPPPPTGGDDDLPF
jgi:hypothetical protein